LIKSGASKSPAIRPTTSTAAAKAGKRAIIIGFLNAYPFGESLEPIDAYYRAGVRSFGFVHAGNNAYADSSRPSGGPKVEWGGLSPLGKAAVGQAERPGRHHRRLAADARRRAADLKLTRAPVVASHSGVKGVVDAPRNLSDAELDAIKANGGVVQVVAFGPYLVRPGPDFAAKVAPIRAQFGLPAAYAKTVRRDQRRSRPSKRTDYSHAINALLPKATVKDLVDSVDYAVKRIGIDHVGLSSDFNHGGGVIGWANEGEAANVTAELVRHGYSEADIDKLWGGNYLRVFQTVEAKARP
jgi:membrane dipeptidase